MQEKFIIFYIDDDCFLYKNYLFWNESEESWDDSEFSATRYSKEEGESVIARLFREYGVRGELMKVDGG